MLAPSTLFLSFSLLSSTALLVNANAIPLTRVHTSHNSTASILHGRDNNNIDTFWYQGSKLGAAWPDGDDSALSKLKGINKYVPPPDFLHPIYDSCNRMYTWTESCPDNAERDGFTCLPQLWGWKNKNAFDKVAKKANPPLFLTFNEYFSSILPLMHSLTLVHRPQESGQSDMDVWSGISLWKQSLKPLHDRGHKLCSPATSSNPNGLTWVKDFKKNCPECKVTLLMPTVQERLIVFKV